MEERKGFPLDFEGRRDALLNIVNTELKSATVLHLDDKAVTGKEILDRIARTIGHYDFLPTKNAFKYACGTTLFSIGAVAKDKIIENGRIGYLLTEDGRKYGLPIAALALDLSYSKNKSFFEILGSTVSSGKIRAPVQRVNILKFLDRNEGSSWKTVSEALNASSSSHSGNLKQLSEIGFISGVPNEEFGEKKNPYYLVKAPDSFKGIPLPHVSEKIISYLSKVESMDTARMARDIREDRGAVSNALKYLFDNGYVGNKRDSRTGIDKMCLDLRLNGEGREFLDNFVYPMEEALCDESALEKITERYNAIASDSDAFTKRVTNGCGLYFPVSPFMNSVGNPTRRVYDYISANPGARPKDIAEKLGLKKVDDAISKLRKERKVVREKDGRNSYYFVVDKD